MSGIVAPFGLRGLRKGMRQVLHRLSAPRVLALASVVALAAIVSSAATGSDGNRTKKLAKINHVVVIYEENHSFDNLYGGWEGVNGLSSPRPRPSATPPTAARPTRRTRCSTATAARRRARRRRRTSRRGRGRSTCRRTPVS